MGSPQHLGDVLKRLAEQHQLRAQTLHLHWRRVLGACGLLQNSPRAPGVRHTPGSIVPCSITALPRPCSPRHPTSPPGPPPRAHQLLQPQPQPLRRPLLLLILSPQTLQRRHQLHQPAAKTLGSGRDPPTASTPRAPTQTSPPTLPAFLLVGLARPRRQLFLQLCQPQRLLLPRGARLALGQPQVGGQVEAGGVGSPGCPRRLMPQLRQVPWSRQETQGRTWPGGLGEMR